MASPTRMTARTLIRLAMILSASLVPFPARAESKMVGHLMLIVTQLGQEGFPLNVGFSNQVKPGPGKELRLRLESNLACRAVIVAFSRQGRMAFEIGRA